MSVAEIAQAHSQVRDAEERLRKILYETTPASPNESRAMVDAINALIDARIQLAEVTK